VISSTVLLASVGKKSGIPTQPAGVRQAERCRRTQPTPGTLAEDERRNPAVSGGP